MASAKAGARSSASRPTSPSTLLSPSSVSATRPRSREPAIAPSRSSKVSLLPGQRHARRQADVLRQRVGRLEIEQRREIDAANLQADAGLGLRRPGFGGALRFGVEAGSRQSSIFSRNGARHTPLTDPWNCAGPSPAAIARSSPSSASRARPCSDDSFNSMLISLRRSLSRSIRAAPRPQASP